MKKIINCLISGLLFIGMLTTCLNIDAGVMQEGVIVSALESETVAEQVENNANSNTAQTVDLRQRNIAIMGDSITHGWLSYTDTFFKKEQILGRGSANVTGSSSMNWKKLHDVSDTSKTYLELLQERQPKELILAFGMNDTGATNLVTKYQELVDAIRAVLPDVKIYIASITPVWEHQEQGYKVKPSDITARNQELANWVTNDSTLTYINVFEALADSNGFAQTTDLREGIHPTKNGYQKYWDYLCNFFGGVGTVAGGSTSSASTNVNQSSVLTGVEFDDDATIDVAQITYKMLRLSPNDKLRLNEIKMSLEATHKQEVIRGICIGAGILGILIILYAILLALALMVDTTSFVEVSFLTILTFGNVKIYDKETKESLSKKERKGYYTPVEFVLKVMLTFISGAFLHSFDKWANAMIYVYTWLSSK